MNARRLYMTVMVFAIVTAMLLVAGPASSRKRGERGRKNVSPPPNRIANGTPDIGMGGGNGDVLSDAYNEGLPYATDLMTRESVGKAGDETIDALKRNANLMKGGGKRVAEKATGWLEKGANFLKWVDFSSTIAKSGAYLMQGNKDGAFAVIVEDVTKKTAAGGGAFLLGWVPVAGPVAGAEIGEQLQQKYLKPVIWSKADEQYYKQKEKEMLNKPWIQPQELIGPYGARTLPEDMYLDKDGIVKRRNPQEQEKYEDEMHTKWLSGKRFVEVENKYKAGDMSKEEYEKQYKDFVNRDRTKPWVPKSYDTDDEDEQGQEQEMDEDEGDDEQEMDEEDEEDYEDDQEKEKEEEGDGGILNYVDPIKVTALGTTEQDLSAGEFKNIATTYATLSFWNVGSKAPGYGGATATFKTTFTMSSQVEKFSCAGSFSGGPNGSFKINCEGETTTLGMSNGSVISGGDLTFHVQNPDAFSNWPKGY